MTNGTFVLADIGGYTHFLSDVGIEHAKEITSHLFNRGGGSSTPRRSRAVRS